MYKAEYESSWPLTIGINKYVVDPLDNAVTDAREVHRLLTDSLGYPTGRRGGDEISDHQGAP